MTRTTCDGPEARPHSLSRRGLLRAAGIAGVVAPFAAFASNVLAGSTDHALAHGHGEALKGPPKKIVLAWNATAVCLSPVALGQSLGIFEKYNIDLELLNFGAGTEQLLEAIATGKADAGVGMALRWLKPLEQGFDVKVTAGTHGGCMRLLAPTNAGISDVRSLKGKTIAVSDMASPAKNFFSILLKKRGIDPESEVEWRQYPADLLPLAVEKGEAHALAEGDPRTYKFLKDSDGKLFQVATNLSEEYQERVCCVLGIRGSLLRDDKPTAAALTRAVLEAQHVTSSDPEAAAKVFLQYSPNSKAEDLVAMLKDQTHAHSPVGQNLKREIAAYAEELKLISVFKPSTDPVKFADRVYADVLT
jgi:NitT/TauT family transport system substrate-binding protein